MVGQSGTNNAYEVEEILDMRVYKNGIRKFKVKWLGYSSRFNSWINEVDMDCPDLIKDFLKNRRQIQQQKKKSMKASKSITKKLKTIGKR
uniref:Chromo domain-containing protein n=1 Tax=Panagrolaimus davidi TaxID=227884 RepID=A0A914QEH3_9BILA